MKQLVYEKGKRTRHYRKYTMKINDNPCDLFNFAADCLGSYLGDIDDDMMSEDAMTTAKGFVEHYDGFKIEDVEEDEEEDQ